jgi:hypothetical protein
MFWIRRYLIVFTAALAIIGGSQLLKGRSLADATAHGLLWAGISEAVYIAVRVYQSRRARHGAVCDTREVQSHQHRSR